MENKAVSNTGPIIHLTEVQLIEALTFFDNVLIPQEVKNEIARKKISIPKKIKVTSLINEWKNLVKIFTNEHDLDLGEAQAIALTLQEKADYFFTDDLDARETGKKYRIEVHGSVGLILRAFAEKIIDKKTAVVKLKELLTHSSLFITKDLVDEAVRAVEEFNLR